MARTTLQATLGQALGEGQFSLSGGSAPDLSIPVTTAQTDVTAVKAATTTANGAHKTSFEAALATLVADAASPTQAHVTAADNAYTLLKADIVATDTAADTAVLSAAAAVTATAAYNVILSVDLAVVTSINALKRTFDVLLLLARGSGKFTA